MSTRVKELYYLFDSRRFPALRKTLGDFGLYDSLLAGFASRAAKGERMKRSEIPIPDEETSRIVRQLGSKEMLTTDEADFLEYFRVMERLRVAIGDEGFD